MVALPRWTLRGRKVGGARPRRDSRDYGLLQPVATAPARAAAELCQRLRTAGIAATCGDAGRPNDRPTMHVLVFPEDLGRARDALRQHH